MGELNKVSFCKIRLSVGERLLLKMHAAQKGLCISEYVRRCCLGRGVGDVHPEVVKALVAISGQLDAIHRELQSGQFRAVDTLESLGIMLSILRELKSLSRQN